MDSIIIDWNKSYEDADIGEVIVDNRLLRHTRNGPIVLALPRFKPPVYREELPVSIYDESPVLRFELIIIKSNETKVKAFRRIA